MKCYNFSAGPSMLFEEVLLRVQKELLDYKGSGMSVMEMSHRSAAYEQINAEAQQLLRSLLNIGDDYEVLFLQGGATLQFEAVPLNLSTNNKADYVVTGVFSKKAYTEAQKLTNARCAGSSEDKNFSYIPRLSKSDFDASADYVHICFNNTIFGTRYDYIPQTPVPLVADMSSYILSEPFNVNDFDVIYAGAQKNIGPAGLTVVIVKRVLLDKFSPSCPTMLRWVTQAKENSLYNTPPAFSIYVALEGFRYLKETGGVNAAAQANRYKAGLLYDFIDNSKMFSNPVQKPYRSLMNVTFTSPDKETDERFCKEAASAGLVALKGHRLTGGMRASIYNAMPVEGVKTLVEFMKKFEYDNKNLIKGK